MDFSDFGIVEEEKPQPEKTKDDSKVFQKKFSSLTGKFSCAIDGKFQEILAKVSFEKNTEKATRFCLGVSKTKFQFLLLGQLR